MNKNIDTPILKHRYTRVFLLWMLLFLLPTLSCSLPLSGDDSLQETQSALHVQETFAAEAAATNAAQEINIAATTTSLAEQQEITAGSTVQAQQATIAALETLASAQLTAQAEKPTEILPTATMAPQQPTNTPEMSNDDEILITEWKTTRFLKITSGCYLTNELCWKGHDDVLSDYTDLVLASRESITIEPSWSNPTLIFWQSYDFPRPARVDIKVDGKWSTLANFSNKKPWHQYTIDLGKYKGKSIIIQFVATGRDRWSQPKAEWFIQDMRIIPNYTP